MKNWKTTLAGLIGALPFAIDALVQAYTAGYFTDKTGWQLFGAIAVIVITSVAKDHNVSGTSKFSNIEEEKEAIGQPFPKKK